MDLKVQKREKVFQVSDFSYIRIKKRISHPMKTHKLHIAVFSHYLLNNEKIARTESRKFV